MKTEKLSIFKLMCLLAIFALSITVPVQAQNCTSMGWATYDGQSASSITGGGSATPIQVTTFSQLKSAAESSSAAVIYVMNDMGAGYKGTSGDVLNVKSNKTIIGFKPNITIKCSWQIKSVSNIIIKNLICRGPGNSNSEQNWDAVNIQGSKKVWFDHCTVMEGEDGNFDIVKGSDNVTATYCKFTYVTESSHNLSNLIGSSDSESESHGKLNVTYAYCWWDNVDQRTPRTRYGKIHVLNCYYNNCGQGPHSGFMSNVRVEGCFFESNVGEPIGMTSPGGQSGCFAIGCNRGSTATDGYSSAFTPPYKYSALSNSSVKALVTDAGCGAGPTLDSPTDCGCGSSTPTNTPPTVSISSPANNATFTAPAPITINANAADANGTVSNVQFYNGSTLLGSDASSPYSFSWTNVAAGTYTLTAKATDNAGAVTTSSSVTIVVNAAANTPPTVSITSPANNATFTAPASITINANAADANGTVSNVQFYNGSTLLGSDASSPYSFSWTNVAAGTYTLTAKATDNAGAVTTSSAVTVVVNAAGNTPPTVSITSPANNATFTAPASININANAADANGTVSNVQFYNGSTLLGNDASPPYSFSWTNVAAGSYTLTAVATDNDGLATTSSAVTVVVNNPTTGTVTIQAETACSVNGILSETKNAGYHGGGYVNLDNATGTAASWSVNSPSAQVVTLSIRYANASTVNRSMSLAVNNATQIPTINFPSTGAWTTWTTVNVQVNLSAGFNMIKMVSLVSEGAPNLDELVFSSSDVSATSCTPPPPPDCAGVSGGSASIDNCSVCSGGTTGITPNSTCTQDCNGVWGGSAFLDDCAICVGGNTGRTPCIVGSTSTIQAETACTVKGIKNETKNAGFNGTGYVNLDNATNTSATWSINSGSAQTVTMTIRYANASTVNRKVSIKVNGTTQVASVDFLSTGAWTIWKTVNVTLNLISGNNSLQITSLVSDGAPNIDEFTFSSGTVTPGSCSSSSASPAKIAGNPSETSFAVSSSDDIQSYTIINEMGLSMEEGGFVAADREVLVGANLKSGTYILKINYVNGTTEIKRLVKD